MKEIKFRVWDNLSKKYITDNEVYIVGGLVDGILRFSSENEVLTHHCIEQYTWHKDKDNVEIYVGDIVQFQSINVWYQSDIMVKKMTCKTQDEFNDWYYKLELPEGVVIESVFNPHEIGQNELTNYYKVIGNIHDTL